MRCRFFDRPLQARQLGLLRISTKRIGKGEHLMKTTQRTPWAAGPLLAAIFAVLTGLSAAHAATVHVDGSIATGVTGLQVGSAIYDVSFTFYATHAEWPGMLDVTTIDAANDVMNALATALDAANVTRIRYTGTSGSYDHTGATIWYGADAASLLGRSISAAGGWSAFIGASNAPLNNARPFAVDLTPVPLPAAAWLFGSALLGLASLARQRKR